MFGLICKCMLFWYKKSYMINGYLNIWIVKKEIFKKWYFIYVLCCKGSDFCLLKFIKVNIVFKLCFN